MIRKHSMPPPGKPGKLRFSEILARYSHGPADYIVVRTTGASAPRHVFRPGDPDLAFPVAASERLVIDIIPSQDIT